MIEFSENEIFNTYYLTVIFVLLQTNTKGSSKIHTKTIDNIDFIKLKNGKFVNTEMIDLGILPPLESMSGYFEIKDIIVYDVKGNKLNKDMFFMSVDESDFNNPNLNYEE